jgi:uncharacterized membrane protein YkoI
MPPVKAADTATNIALSFLRKSGWDFVRALSAHRKDGAWLVEVDVGALNVRKGSVKIDAKTGSVLEYDVPQKIR